MAAFLLLSMVVGLLRGVVFEVLALAGWFVAYFAAAWFAASAQPYLHIGAPGSALNYGVAFACVFVVTLIVWSVAARLIRALIRATPLSLVDRLLGGCFGLARGIVVLLLVVVMVGASPWAHSTPWRRSEGVARLDKLLQELRPMLDNGFSSHPSA